MPLNCRALPKGEGISHCYPSYWLYSSSCSSAFFQLQHTPFLIHAFSFTATPGSLSFCLIAKLRCCFLTVSSSLCFCIFLLQRSLPYPSHIFSELHFSPSSQWLCPVFITATVCLLEMSYLFYLLSNKQETLLYCWDMPEGWGWSEKGHVLTLETIVSHLETTSVC